jgi:hypothetical protein
MQAAEAAAQWLITTLCMQQGLLDMRLSCQGGLTLGEGSMTGPVSMWHSARSVSDSGFASDVRKSASRKSAQVTSRNGVATRLRVWPKNSRVSCGYRCAYGTV